jgi:hypothetical protein
VILILITVASLKIENRDSEIEVADISEGLRGP